MPFGRLYFRRFRMEVDLSAPVGVPPLASGYRFLPWSEALCEAHAETKFLCFRDELDAEVFPCFTELDGCRRLMRSIVARDGFQPEATWLVAFGKPRDLEFCGTIQGVRDARGFGAVQNLGVLPEHRGRGLGEALMCMALAGFRRGGIRKAFLEVTADNGEAVRLYERIGFRRVRTVYKSREPTLSRQAVS